MLDIAAAIADVQAVRLKEQPAIEGLKDLAAVNLRPESMAVVRGAVEEGDAVLVDLDEAVRALQKLKDRGYPNFLARKVSAAVLADLRNQRDTIVAALERFSVDEDATNLNATGTAEPL